MVVVARSTSKTTTVTPVPCNGGSTLGRYAISTFMVGASLGERDVKNRCGGRLRSSARVVRRISLTILQALLVLPTAPPSTYKCKAEPQATRLSSGWRSRECCRAEQSVPKTHRG